MRISDWSSDVCSSDLFVVINTEIEAGLMHAYTGRLGLLFRHPVIDHDRASAVDHGLGSACAFRAGCVAALFLHLMHEVYGAVAPVCNRQEERRVGEGWVGLCGSRSVPYP